MLSSCLSGLPAPDDRLRLFCLHHAGGGASAYAQWAGLVGGEVDVLPVQLPGRENRIDEPRGQRMDELVPDLIAGLGEHLRPPFAFYGHSMGALVAYALTEALPAHGLPMPEVLLLGAYPTPDRHRFMRRVPHLTPGDLVGLLRRLGGASDLTLRYPAWRDAAVASIRDDLMTCHSYRPGTNPITCDIQVFVGKDDPVMDRDEAAGWARHTTGTFRMHSIPGGHFFVRDSPDLFFPALREALGLPQADRRPQPEDRVTS